MGFHYGEKVETPCGIGIVVRVYVDATGACRKITVHIDGTMKFYLFSVNQIRKVSVS